jgi:TonB family protein
VARAEKNGVIAADSSAGHLALGLNDRADANFEFSMKPRRTLAAFSVSFLLQATILVALYFTGRAGLQAIGVLPTPEESLRVDLVYLQQPGPGGGGGGGGNRMPEPPKKAEAKGQDSITVPAAPTPTFEATVEHPPLAQVIIPVQNTSQGLQDSLGAVQPIGPFTTSRGPGSGDGAGSGRGPGIGPGVGPGLGPGRDGGMGGEVYGPGSGATDPVATLRVEPKYTSEAMLARVQGSVWITCIVRPNGICTDARVTRAPDPPYGLDRAALEAVGRWRFVPGRKGTQPVSVAVSIQLDFNVR